MMELQAMNSKIVIYYLH